MTRLHLVSDEDKFLVAELAKSGMTASLIGNKFGFNAAAKMPNCTT